MAEANEVKTGFMRLNVMTLDGIVGRKLVDFLLTGYYFFIFSYNFESMIM